MNNSNYFATGIQACKVFNTQPPTQDMLCRDVPDFCFSGSLSIPRGSIINVLRGTSALIVCNGEVSHCYTKPGRYVYDDSPEPSFLYNNGIGELAGHFIKNLYYGSGTYSQRVVQVNTLPIRNQKIKLRFPVSISAHNNLKCILHIRASGFFDYRITNPRAFFENFACSYRGATHTKSVTAFIRKRLSANIFSLMEQRRFFSSRISIEQIIPLLNQLVSNIAFTDKHLGIFLNNVGFTKVKPEEEDANLYNSFRRSSMISSADPQIRELYTYALIAGYNRNPLFW